MYWPALVSKFGEGSFTIGSIIQTTIGHFSTEFDYKGKEYMKNTRHMEIRSKHYKKK